MKRVGSALRLLGLYFRLNLAAALEYRASFFMAAFGMVLSNSAFVFFWWIAFEQIGGRIGGYDFRDVMFIWALTSTAFGLSNILFANMNHLSRLIVTGELDAFLLQPKDVLMSVLCARTNLSAWGDFAYGLLLMALTGQGARAWGFFGLGAVTGGLLMTATAVVFNSLSFYLGDASAAGSMALEFIINFCIYPEGIYRGMIRLLMYTLIPASFMVHLPLKLARGLPGGWIALLIGATLLYCAGAYALFYRGLKKYESGNLIVTRM